MAQTGTAGVSSRGHNPRGNGHLLRQHLLRTPPEQARPVLMGMAATWRAMQEEAVVLGAANALRRELEAQAAELRRLPIKVKGTIVDDKSQTQTFLLQMD